MLPVMTPKEIHVFESFLRCSRNYIEFGSGGSTYMATKFVRESVTSVDSSRSWLNEVKDACAASGHAVSPTLVFADIGPTTDWGAPRNETFRERWPAYYGDVWDLESRKYSDLYLIDGRFRVACFMSVLQRCQPDSTIIIHDFYSRERYHCIKSVARQIAGIDDLAIFTPDRSVSKSLIHEIMKKYKYDPL